MRLKIFSIPDMEPEVSLMLVQSDEGVMLVAVDPMTGKRLLNSTLLVLRENGTVCRSWCVNHDLGFKLDANGRIVLYGE